VTVALRAGAASLVALSLVACGGGGKSADEQAIEDMVGRFFRGFEDGDAATLASLFGQECGDMTAAAESAIGEFERFDAKVSLDRVRVRNITDVSAEFLPEGTIESGGEEVAISTPDDEFSLAVKEGGVWKIAECDLFL
jgi:hypothetical protein